MQTEQRIFLDTAYSYRRWPYYLIAVGVPALDMSVLILNMHHFTNGQFLAENWFGVVAGSLWLLTTLYFAGLCGWRIVFAPVERTRIDTAGITVDQLKVSWAEIASLYGRPNGWRRVSLFYTKRGIGWLARERMLASEPLLETEYQELCGTITEYVGKEYPEVLIG